ncbi:MAG: hypothetical protein ACO3LH_11010 [Steroidobacteraceae bacterium]
MKPLTRGLLLAGIQLLLALAVAGTLLYERNTLPRVWAETTGFDPLLPIRGRYVELNLVVDLVPGEAPSEAEPAAWRQGRLDVRGDRLVATLLPEGEYSSDTVMLMPVATPAGPRWAMVEPVAFFLPEEAEDPTRLDAGEVLWAEVSVPERGSPRPIRLEVRPLSPGSVPADTASSPAG